MLKSPLLFFFFFVPHQSPRDTTIKNLQVLFVSFTNFLTVEQKCRKLLISPLFGVFSFQRRARPGPGERQRGLGGCIVNM